jgi:hypothetical protein
MVVKRNLNVIELMVISNNTIFVLNGMKDTITLKMEKNMILKNIIFFKKILIVIL